MLFRIFEAQSYKVQQFPPNGRQVSGLCAIDCREIRRAIMEAEKGDSDAVVEAGLEVSYEPLSRRQQFVEADRKRCHAM
jgi:hypothetical protein